MTTKFPGQVSQAYPEAFTTIPTEPSVKKPGFLTSEQVHQFFEEGYVQIDSFFSPSELEPVKAAIELLVEGLAQKLYNGGKIKKLYQDYGLYERLIKLEEDFPGANIMLHKLGELPQAFRDLWSNERLLDVAEQLVGTTDIVGHPVWNIRTKTPKNEATTVPWHQDCAYLDQDSYKTLQLTAWIPMLDTNADNGCMEIVKRGHRTGKIATHTCCHGDTWYVMLAEDEMEKTLEVNFEEDKVLCPVPYGGLLLFSNALPHRSLNNCSKQVRWSFDFRWQRADKPVGFYGLKEGVRMRSSNDPNFKIDWESFDAVNRHKKAFEDASAKEAEFDTTIPGPWMRNWEMVHTNRHTDALEAQEKAKAESHNP